MHGATLKNDYGEVVFLLLMTEKYSAPNAFSFKLDTISSIL